MSAETLERRVQELGTALPEFSEELRLAYQYLRPDAASSLTKSRVILERLVRQLYLVETGTEPTKSMLGQMLEDKRFARQIERRILSRMNAIRDMANLGPHGESVLSTDATRVLDDLCDVLDWYLRRYRLRSAKRGNRAEQQKMLQEVARALCDNDPHVRSLACHALLGIGWRVASSTILARLVELLGDRELEPREAAVQALSQMNVQAISPLIIALEHKDPIVRSGAAYALGKMGPIAKSAAPALTALLRDREYYVRRDSARALRGLSVRDSDVLNALVEALTDDDEIVRAIAQDVLRETNPEVLVACLGKSKAERVTGLVL